MTSVSASSQPLRERNSKEWKCVRCGYLHSKGKNNKSGLCVSCRLAESSPLSASPTRSTSSGNPDLSPCRAWLRDFDNLDHPIHPDGTFVAPGRRLCGHSDCVAPDHVIVEEQDVA